MSTRGPQGDAALVAQVETLLDELRIRLDARAGEVVDDPVATDELFVLAGQLDAVLRAETEHLQALRAALDQSAREQ